MFLACVSAIPNLSLREKNVNFFVPLHINTNDEGCGLKISETRCLNSVMYQQWFGQADVSCTVYTCCKLLVFIVPYT